MKGLNDASPEAKLTPKRAALNTKPMIPAELNCALCACAALCAHIFQDVDYTSGKVLRVMWEEIINTKKKSNLSLSEPEQKIQQHQLSFQYFSEVFKSGTVRAEPWRLMKEPRAVDIDHVNRTQQDGMKEFIEMELERKEKILKKLGKKGVIAQKSKTDHTLKDAIKLMGKKGPNWIFALLVIGESFSAEPGSKTEFFGHWNFAYLTRDKEARFVDYQGAEAVRSEWPICAAANNLLAEPGGQQTLLIAVKSKPFGNLIPEKKIGHPPKKASEPKHKNPSSPHANAKTHRATRVPKTATRRPSTGFPKEAATTAAGSPAPQPGKPTKAQRRRNGSPKKRRPRAGRSPKK